MRISNSLVGGFFGALSAAVLLACTQDLPTGANDLTVSAAKGAGGGTKTTTGPTVSSASPNLAKRSTTLDVRILGSGFDRSMTARWGIDSVVTADVVVNSTRYVSTTELVANITVTSNAQLTSYDIIITSTKTGKPGIGTEMFEVVETLPLTSLGGGYSGANAISDNGVIAGWSSYIADNSNNGFDRPVIWQNGVIRDLLPSGYLMGHATDVNENGQVVGWVARTSDNYILPFVWSAATGMTILPTPAGEDNSGAMAINDNGVIVGYSGAAAVMWVNGTMTVIHTVANQFSTASDVNSAGEIIGYYQPTWTDGPYNAFIWRPGAGVQMLSTLNGTLGLVSGINDNGQIVGTGPLPGDTTSYAFVIENGVARRLSSPALGGTTAAAISETGNVVGYDSFGRGIMWTAGGAEVVLCTPPAAARGANPYCSVHGVNTSGVTVGLRTDQYGQKTGAYQWTLTSF